jgi:choline-sulfatase
MNEIMQMARPNIVMIMADQMMPNVIGALGHPVVKTPHIDSLVHNGVAFTNCYCNSPLCVPSRASMMAGKLPSNIEVYDNGSEFRASIPTFVHHLRRGGYETILSGKMHFIGPDQLHGFEQRLTKELQPVGFHLTPDWTKGVHANPGTGIKRLANPGVCDWNNQLEFDEKTHHQTLDKIRRLGRKPEKQPFFLCTTYMHPHDPFVMTKEYWDRYEGVEIPMPEVPLEPLGDMHPYNQWIQVHHEADQCQLTDEEIRMNRRAYYGMVSYIDDKVGDILHELKRMNLLDNTIVILVSDHGEMLGEHGMWFKRTFYDPAAKVPLIFSWPGHFPAGKRVEEVVSLVDFGNTLMKLAEVPDADDRIADTDGGSFHRLLNGDDAEWKNEAICEYFGEGPIRPMLALRRGVYKYVHVHENEPLLFDLDKDPHERHNVFGKTGYQEIGAELRERVLRDFDFVQIEARIMQSQKERLILHEALQKGERTKWDHVPPS